MDDESRLLEVAASQGWMVSLDDVTAAGISLARWQRWEDEGRWCQVAPGCFRHVATALTFDMQVKAGAAWIGRRGALFGATALRWLGVEVDEPERAEFLVPRHRRSIPNWMTVHTTLRWDEHDVIRHRGVRTTTATRALIDMAGGGYRAAQVEAAIDSAIRLRRTALPRLTRRLADLSGSGRAGVVLMRELLLDSGGESYLERRFLRLVREAGLPRPATQVVHRSNGTTVARVDFMFGPDAVVEVSGRLGHVSDRDRQRDTRRRNALQRPGLIFIEFTTADVIDDPPYVLSTLRSRLPVAALSTSLRGRVRDRNR